MEAPKKSQVPPTVTGIDSIKMVNELAEFEAELNALTEQDKVQQQKQAQQQQQQKEQQQKITATQLSPNELYQQLTTPITSTSNNNSNTPLVGHNRNLREYTRVFLGITAVALFCNYNSIATISSGGAIIMMKGGTFFSTKNLRWGTLSVLSFILCLTSYCLNYTASYIHTTEHHSDTTTTTKAGNDVGSFAEGFFIGYMKFIQMFWASLLTFILIITYTTRIQEHDKKIQKLQPVKIE